MKEKTKLKIIQKIAQHITLEQKLNQWQKVATWSSYMLEITLFQICLLISITQPQLHINKSIREYPGVELVLFAMRMIVPVVYLVSKSPYVIPLIKLLQMMNVYLIRTEFCAIPLAIEGLAQIMLTIRKEKRNINFDSRLQSKYFGTKIFALYILLFSSFLTSNDQISKNPSAVFFTSIIYYVAACLDNIYSYRTKQILRNIALCPVLMAIYFMCVPLVPAFDTFGTAAHTIVSCTLMFVIIIYAIITEYSYNHEILNKKILNLQSRDKLLYIWSLIYFSESPSHNDLICFLKTHQSKCMNSLCPLNFNQKQKDSTNIYSKETIQSHLKIYLKKALERFASQSDEVRRLFIYYRKEDDPKLIHLLRQDDIYQKIQQFRISKNLERYTDPSLEYEQMKEIQQETLAKVKLYLNHYDYFLTYINKETISMETSEEIIKEILKLKNYFLSFKPNSMPQIDDEKLSTKSGSKSKKKGYEKLETQTIPIKKMTLKTVALVNFMRKFYFSLPCIEKQEFAQKKLNYISQDFEQSPILIISAESYNLGKIVNWNSMAQKILLYSTKELRTKFINDLLPKCMQKIHQKIFMKAALSIELGEVRKQLAAFVFCFTKAGYTQIFEVKIQGANSISGNKWIVEMKHHFQNQAVVICDEYRTVIGVNRNAINFEIAQNFAGELMNQELFNRLISKQKEKVTFSSQEQPIEGFKIDKQTKWQLVCSTPFIEDMPKFYIFLVENAKDNQRMNSSKFSKNHSSVDIDAYQPPTNGFQINFDPYLLKYSTLPMPPHQEADLQMIWQEDQSIDENDVNQVNYVSSAQRQAVNYGQNIHEMIYFDSKLEFKENYEVVTEFETHPYYVPNGRMTVNKNVLRVNINKENFIENVGKIKEKVPSYLFKIVLVFAVVSVVWITSLAFRYLQFKNLYSGSQEKQLISQQLIKRKNIISNIGSLAIYNAKANLYPGIWQRYLTNNWTFAKLFVEIQYTNSNINKLNPDIGLLVSKSYSFNGKTKTLASYFESLSIQASLQLSGQLNLTQFILEIVDDVQTLESNIQKDFTQYYTKKNDQHKLNIFIIDICQLAACLIAAIFCHFILKKAYNERVHIFKSLSVIEEEQIYRIQKSVSEHREHIKNNELDAIHEQDYSQPLESENIPHSKKMMNNYFKDRTLFFYVYMLVVIIVFCGIFPLSQISYDQVNRVQLITPFINIIGGQRNSMSKLYLNVIAGTKNDTWISTNIISNVRMFETNKKGVIDSLIAKKFTDNYLNFYNQIWFNPCDILDVPQQCAELFSGILSDNLDYNYVYVLTEVEKIVDYRLQSITPPFSLDPQFIKDVNSEIQLSYKKINFLLFDFMTKLNEVFTKNIVSQIQELFEFISTFNLIQFLLIIIGCCGSMTIMVIFTYWIKDLHKVTLEMVTTVVPYSMLMRNEYFADWYKNKFKNMY